jgi:hypothetical protein
MEKRMELREGLIGHRAKRALEFQTKAIRLLGPPAGIMARQLIFWDTRGHDPKGWIYKSRRELEVETGLTRRQQEKARKVLRGRGLMEEEPRPVGPMKRRTMHYRLDLVRLMDLLQVLPDEDWGPGDLDDVPAYDDLEDIPF